MLLSSVMRSLRGGLVAVAIAGILVKGSSGEDAGESGNKSGGVPPVKVKILDEALCPGCKEFVNTVLTPVYQHLGATVIDLQVVPFGNARYVESKDDPEKKVLECQHGEAECDANSYEQCASILLYPYPQRYLPFIDCLYQDLPMGYSDKKFDRSIFANCARKAALDWDSIADCHDNEYQAAALQEVAYSLTPDYHEYVPWVEINGEPLDMEDDQDFIKAVCAAYIESGGSNPYCDPSLLSQLSSVHIQTISAKA